MTANTLKALVTKVEDGAVIAISGFIPDDPTGYVDVVGDNNHVEAIVEHREATAEQPKITLCNGGIMAGELRFSSSF